MTSASENLLTRKDNDKEEFLPNGWLISPDNNFVLLFVLDKKEYGGIKHIFTHLFFANAEGEPSNLKNSRIQNKRCASETWNELISNGWEKIYYPFE